VGIGRRLREVAPVWILVAGTLLAGCSGASDTETAPPTAATGAHTGAGPESGLPWISRSDLPPEALDTLEEIAAGPPYTYDRDGVTFENREGLLPAQERGYYEEFTVETPGSADRGARRIIWGLQDELYYTDDHYQSFERIAP
jgi:ribonuclease T1